MSLAKVDLPLISPMALQEKLLADLMAVLVAPYTAAPYLMPGPAPVRTTYAAAFLPSCLNLCSLLLIFSILLCCTLRLIFLPAEKSTPSNLDCLTMRTPNLFMWVLILHLLLLPAFVKPECTATDLAPASPRETTNLSLLSSSMMHSVVAFFKLWTTTSASFPVACRVMSSTKRHRSTIGFSARILSHPSTMTMKRASTAKAPPARIDESVTIGSETTPIIVSRLQNANASSSSLKMTGGQ